MPVYPDTSENSTVAEEEEASYLGRSVPVVVECEACAVLRLDAALLAADLTELQRQLMAEASVLERRGREEPHGYTLGALKGEEAALKAVVRALSHHIDALKSLGGVP